MVEALGWVATAVFVLSYFCRRPVAMRRVQMLGALLWIAYGALLGASPVVVANLLVFGAAAWTAARRPSGPDADEGAQSGGSRVPHSRPATLE